MVLAATPGDEEGVMPQRRPWRGCSELCMAPFLSLDADILEEAGYRVVVAPATVG